MDPEINREVGLGSKRQQEAANDEPDPERFSWAVVVLGRLGSGPKQLRARQRLFVLLAVIDDLEFDVLAPRAFKRALIVTRFIGLDASEPHVSVTHLARGVRDHPPFREYLIRSHASRPNE